MISVSIGVFLILTGAMILYSTWRYYQEALVPRKKPRVDPAFFSAMGFEPGDSLLVPSPTQRPAEAFQSAMEDSSVSEEEPVVPIGFETEESLEEDLPPPILDAGKVEEPSLHPKREEDNEPQQQNLGF